MTRNFKVTVKVVREHFATITVRARDQEEADEKAIAAYYETAAKTEGMYCPCLGIPKPWHEPEPIEHEAVIDQRFRCVDCGKDTMEGEYYSVYDEVWAASGMEPHGGMLCLAHLEERIGRRLTPDDFTCMWPRDWQRHVAARTDGASAFEAVQLELLKEP